MRSKLSTLCEVAGFALVAVGVGMLSPALGVIAGGVGLVAIGVLAALPAPGPVDGER